MPSFRSSDEHWSGGVWIISIYCNCRSCIYTEFVDICVCGTKFLCLVNVGCFHPLDMLQLISNPEMEFGGLFDNPPYTGLPPPPQENPGLTKASTPAPPTITTTAPPSSSSSSIVSSSPHLDALLGPPIIRSSSNSFLPPTFQQSPLTQVSSSTQRQQTAASPQALSVEPPQTNLSPSSPVQASSSHGSPGPNPGISSTPQGIFASPAPQSPNKAQLQTQIQIQTQNPTQQTQTSYNKNSLTGKDIL